MVPSPPDSLLRSHLLLPRGIGLLFRPVRLAVAASASTTLARFGPALAAVRTWPWWQVPPGCLGRCLSIAIASGRPDARFDEAWGPFAGRPWPAEQWPARSTGALRSLVQPHLFSRRLPHTLVLLGICVHAAGQSATLPWAASPVRPSRRHRPMARRISWNEARPERSGVQALLPPQATITAQSALVRVS